MARPHAIRTAALALLLASVPACAPTLLPGGAGHVTIVERAPRGCQRLGEVEGGAGGWLTGDFTSSEDLETSARNRLRKRAHALGADTVQIVHREGITAQSFAGASEPRRIRYRGVAWRCAR
jgi:hypothetical protein